MEINENAPGNISQSPVTRSTDNETGFDLSASDRHETGSTDPMPLVNEPLVTEAGDDRPPLDDEQFDALPPGNPVDDPNVPVEPPMDEDDEPSPGNR